MTITYNAIKNVKIEWSLPIPEVRGSNPVIGKKYFILSICFEKTKIKKKLARNGPSFLKKECLTLKPFFNLVRLTLIHRALYLTYDSAIYFIEFINYIKAACNGKAKIS